MPKTATTRENDLASVASDDQSKPATLNDTAETPNVLDTEAVYDDAGHVAREQVREQAAQAARQSFQGKLDFDALLAEAEANVAFGPFARPEYKPFAYLLRRAMEREKMKASDLARKVWGSTTDSRGYSVAKSRDRIGGYRNAVAFPEPQNLERLAEALNMTVHELAPIPPGEPAMRPKPVDNPGHKNPGPTSGFRATRSSGTLTIVQVERGKMRIVLDQVVPTGIAMEIVRLIESVTEIAPGTVIEGGNGNGNGNGNADTNAA